MLSDLAVKRAGRNDWVRPHDVPELELERLGEQELDLGKEPRTLS